MGDDPWHGGECLDIVDRGRCPEWPGRGRDRRSRAYCPPPSLQRVDQRGFLARDVGTGTLHDLHLEARCAAVQVAPQVTGRGGFCRGCLSRSSAAGYSDRTYTYPRSAPTACAAYASPASTRCGSRSISTRSQNEPGSPSSPLPTTYRGTGPAAAADHFAATGNSAPPRPRNPDVTSSSISLCGDHDPRTSGQCCQGSSPATMPASTTGSVMATTGIEGASGLPRANSSANVGPACGTVPSNSAGAA